MTRPIHHLGLLVSSTLAFAALAASFAWAGDRYGPAGGSAQDDYAYQARASEVDEVDPCTRQYHLTGRGCASGDAGYDRETRGYRDRSAYEGRDRDARSYSRETVEEIDEVDPCARQFDLTGRGCLADRSGWRAERVYDGADERAFTDERIDDRDGYAGAVQACTCEESGSIAPSRFEGRARGGEERVVWVEERLPDSFFFDGGGAGPGIVDFGGGGGGGGNGFVSVVSSANAHASASAYATASAMAMIKNRQMMNKRYGSKPSYGGGWRK